MAVLIDLKTRKLRLNTMVKTMVKTTHENMHEDYERKLRLNTMHEKYWLKNIG